MEQAFAEMKAQLEFLLAEREQSALVNQQLAGCLRRLLKRYNKGALLVSIATAGIGIELGSPAWMHQERGGVKPYRR